MAIPGTLTYEGPTEVSQAQYDEIPDMEACAAWLSDRSVVDIEADPVVDVIDHLSWEMIWEETGYEASAILLEGEAVAMDALASQLSADYGFDLYDQTGGKWYAFLPDDRSVA
jgi:hypothetical protein